MNEFFFETGLEIVLFFQRTFGEWVATPSRIISFIGDEEFFLLVLPLIYWSVHSALGLRIGFMLLLSNGVNGIFKLVFSTPRPFFYSTEVQPLTFETSFGIPSGHAQNAAAVWGVVAAFFNKTWGWILLVSLIILIGLSRLSLGVHFPIDVLAGWAVGFALLWLVIRLEKPVLSWLKNLPLTMRLITAFLASLIIIFFGLFARSLAIDEIPATWIANAAQAFPDEAPINPLRLDGIFTSAGTLFGLASGAILLQAYSGFEVSGPWWKRLARYPIGMIGVILLYFGLSEVFPRGDDTLAYSLRYLRYFLVGIWVAAGAPLTFFFLRLASPRPAQEDIQTIN
ncbi:MAG: phosphatase PAP2 family protein [Anaerolineales bacterium]|nr:phosphatase PAP2 family protein [Anaerolineales bacterium]